MAEVGGRWLREPLLHFLLIGGILFAAGAWFGRDDASDHAPEAVRVSASEVTWLEEMWTRQWGRRPSDTELRGVVRDHVREVLLAREAVALGLDRDDVIVRKRLAQKMEYLVRDAAGIVEPDSAALATLYAADPARWMQPTRVSFSQVFFRTEAAARRGLVEIVARPAGTMGDATMLEPGHADVDEREVAAVFGPDFARTVFALEPGHWSGPVASAYGFHLVRVEAREGAAPLPFAEARASLHEEWQRARREQAEREFLTGLRQKYRLVLDDSVTARLGPLEPAAQ